MLRLLKHIGLSFGILVIFFPPGGQVQAAGGEVIGVTGAVQLQPAGTRDFRPAGLLEAVEPGAKVQTADGQALILFAPGILVRLSPHSRLEVVQGEFFDRQLQGELTLRLQVGEARLSVAPASPRQRLHLYGARTVAVIPKGKAILAVEAEDRLSFLEGPIPVRLKHQASGQEIRLAPGQTAVAGRGDLSISRTPPGAPEKRTTEAAWTALPPPAHIQRPPLPVTGPVTLEEQVRPPWPVLPPVDQTPHLWLFGP